MLSFSQYMHIHFFKINSYIKTHSMGEFIFDNAWAEAAFRANLEYYPKVLVAVPFTPASGARILVKEGLSKPVRDEIRRMVGIFLKDLAQNNGFSSVHVNFCEEDEVRALKPAGYMHRKSMQFHWLNRYTCICVPLWIICV